MPGHPPQWVQDGPRIGIRACTDSVTLPENKFVRDHQQQKREKLGKNRGKYRLLSEAEWEYAARAVTPTAYPWGDKASHEYANYRKDECCGGFARGPDKWADQTASVGQFPPNKFGLYDMHGIVWVWVEDCWHDSYDGAPTDGRAWPSGDCSRRVLCGGSWYVDPQLLRSAYRFRDYSALRNNGYGFPVARTF